MAADSYGSHNEPQFSATGAPDDANDLTTLGAYAAKVGNRKVGTNAQRSALSGSDIWAGLEFYETDTKSTYVTPDGTSWVKESMFAVGSVASGTLSGAVSFLQQAGSAIVSLSSTGAANFTFPTAFPNGVLTVIALNGDDSARPQQFVSVRNVSVTGFDVRFTSGTSAAGSGSARVNWFAIGW
ncbi:gp53-like domain-containing protein [Gryllotalpicola koreensis]|uniref:Putative tail fiber protein gp53-like C-terminal domain-containing protein n=1 Tax=Gryllotalpicola koreensis TaxID=993086 RepID=A0ABP8A1M7_9MICO